MLGSFLAMDSMKLKGPLLTEKLKPAFVPSLIAIVSGQAAAGTVALLTEVVYARLLGPAGRGLIGLCLMCVAFGTLVGGFGLEAAIVYWVSRSRRNDMSWAPAIAFWGVLGSSLAMCLWQLAYWRFHFPFLRGIPGSAASATLFAIPVAILFVYVLGFASGIEQFRLRSACATLRQITGALTFLILLTLIGRSASAALWGNATGLLVGSFAALYLLRRHFRGSCSLRGAVDNLGPTLSYGVRGQVGNIATFFNYRLDVFIVNYFLSASQLGFYALGVVVSEALWQIPQAVATALFPRTARQSDQDAAQFTCFVLRQLFLVSLLCGIVIAALAPIFIPLFLGSQFKPSIAVIWWILPGTIALSMGKVACADLAGRGKNGYSSVFAFVCFAVTAVLDWTLIPRMGILGAALASSITYLLDTVLILAALRYELRVSSKSLFIPTARDLEAYRALWNRLKSMATHLRSHPAQMDVALESQEAD